MKPKKLEFARVYLEMGEDQPHAAQDVWIANPVEGFTYMVYFWRRRCPQSAPRPSWGRSWLSPYPVGTPGLWARLRAIVAGV